MIQNKMAYMYIFELGIPRRVELLGQCSDEECNYKTKTKQKPKILAHSDLKISQKHCSYHFFKRFVMQIM